MRAQCQEYNKEEGVDHLPHNSTSMTEGVEDCTFKDVIPIKDRLSNLDVYHGKARNQKIVSINSKNFVISNEICNN